MSPALLIALLHMLTALVAAYARVDYEGLGLELYVVLLIIAAAAGYASALNGRKRLTLHPSAASSCTTLLGPEPRSPVMGKGGPGQAVLIVTDCADTSERISQLIAPAFRLYICTDGSIDGALASARRVLPEVIIADVGACAGSPRELCERLRADDRLAHIAVIMLAAGADRQDHVEGLLAGADAVIGQPLDADLLLAQLHRLISRGERSDERSQRGDARRTVLAEESADQQLMRRFAELAEENIDNAGCGVEYIAFELGLSPRQFRRRVKQATGDTPGEILRRFRLDRAEHLLREKSSSVSEICFLVGYSSPSSFSVQFKGRFGICPSRYEASSSTVFVDDDS